MLKSTKYFLVLLIALGPLFLCGQNYDDVKKEIDKIVYLDAQLDLMEIPNVIIGIANGDSTFYYQYNFDVEKKVKLDERSIFEIGDLSKALTGLICYWLAEKGSINLGDSLEIHSFDKDTAVLFPATIEQILSHRSGLPIRPREFGSQEEDLKNPYANYSKDELIKHFLENEYWFDKKGKFLYSHFGYALLEVWIEQQTNVKFEKLAELFFKNCFLENTSMNMAHEDTLIHGHDRMGDQTPLGLYPSFGAAEGFKSTAEDLLKIGRKSWTAPEPWLRNSFAQYWKMPENKKMKVSTGWYIHQSKRFSNVILQSGSSTGHRSFLGFVPETKTAVVVLTDSVKSHNGLGFLILKMLNMEWKHPLGKQ